MEQRGGAARTFGGGEEIDKHTVQQMGRKRVLSAGKGKNYSQFVAFIFIFFYRKCYLFQFSNVTVEIVLHPMYCRNSLYYYTFISPLVGYKYYFEMF